MDTFLVNWYLITRVEQFNEIWKIFILFSKLEADSQQKKCIQFVRQYNTFQTNNIKKLLLLANLYY